MFNDPLIMRILSTCRTAIILSWIFNSFSQVPLPSSSGLLLLWCDNTEFDFLMQTGGDS